MAKKQVEWYQSGDFVTASLKLRPVKPPQTLGEIKAEFHEQHCAVYEGGELYWETELAGRIVPSQCKVKPGRVRVELKLKKAELLPWTDYEIQGQGPQPSAVASSNGDHTQKQVPSTGGASSSSATPPQPKKIVPQDLTYVNHLPHDFYDMGGDTVNLKIQLSHLNETKCKVTFQENSMELQFQTNDDRFLSSHKGSTLSTTFVWNIQLSGAIDASASHYSFKPDSLNVVLRKKTPGQRWKTLEATRHSHGITSSSSNGNPSDVHAALNDLDIALEAMNLQSNQQPTISNDITITSQQKVANLELNTPSSNGSNSSHQKSPDPPRNQSQTPTSPSSGGHTPSPSSTSGDHHQWNYPGSGGYHTDRGTTTASGGSSRGPSISKFSPGGTLAADLEISNPFFREHQLSHPSFTGLCNIGNSCFMNSVIQCLSNTLPVRDYFVNGRHLADINRDNPLGFKGELAKAFSFLIRKLWSGEYEYFAPKKLRSVIASRSSHFGNYQQHDSHEFMSYLLDGLHEDLNRIRKKPQTPTVESDGRPDAEVAAEAWKVYKMRNDSYFVDLFQGLFKSTLVCAVCAKESVTFDPFMSMSVPIPGKLRNLPVFFVPSNPRHLPTKYILKLPPDGNLELLKGSVAKRRGISMSQLRVFEAYNGKFQNMLSSNRQPIKDIGDNDVIIVSEVLSERSAREKVVELHVIQRLQFPPYPSKCATCSRSGEDLKNKEGKKIQRCSKCKAVGYCSSECQRRDWSCHKVRCRGGRPTPVGLPFVISLPQSKLTYSRLASVAEKFARFSVEVTRNDNVTSHGTKSAESRVSGEGGEATCGQDKEGGGEGEGEKKQLPMYTFTPVDRYGDNKGEAERLQDLGDGLLKIDSPFLAMDWRNNPKEAGSVTITTKPTLDFQLDPVLAAEIKGQGSKDHSNDLTLEECLERFTEPESLTQEDSWYCPRCKKHCEATKQMSVWRLPDILIVHLKRFSFRNGYYRDKIMKLVKFPISGLDMSPYLLGDAANQISAETPPLYDLHAVVYHYGNSYIGHYTNTAKAPSSEGLGKDYRWLYYDDENVYQVKDEKVVDKNAYILFYTRRIQSTKPQL